MDRESIFVKVYDIEVWNVMRKRSYRREEEKLEREANRREAMEGRNMSS